jgi:hypothetical protein
MVCDEHKARQAAGRRIMLQRTQLQQQSRCCCIGCGCAVGYLGAKAAVLNCNIWFWQPRAEGCVLKPLSAELAGLSIAMLLSPHAVRCLPHHLSLLLNWYALQTTEEAVACQAGKQAHGRTSAPECRGFPERKRLYQLEVNVFTYTGTTAGTCAQPGMPAER